jgi:hypothetical protein
MYGLLVRLMALAVLIELGTDVSDLAHCHSRQCLRKIEKRSRDILKVDWKPISLFPKG